MTIKKKKKVIMRKKLKILMKIKKKRRIIMRKK